MRILLVAGDLDAAGESAAIIRLAEALVDEHTVFFLSAWPRDGDREVVAQVDERVIFLEGTLGPALWSASTEHQDQTASGQSSRRSEILRELIRLHRIDVIHTFSWPADCLILPIIPLLEVPWLIHLSSVLEMLAGFSGDERESRRRATAVLNAATGIFRDHPSDFTRFEEWAIPVRSGQACWLIDRESPIDRIAATCARAYLDVSTLLSFERNRQIAKPDEHESRAFQARSSA